MQPFDTNVWVCGMTDETSAAPQFYTSEFLRNANETLLEGFGIQQEDITPDISEQVYIYLIQNVDE